MGVSERVAAGNQAHLMTVCLQLLCHRLGMLDIGGNDQSSGARVLMAEGVQLLGAESQQALHGGIQPDQAAVVDGGMAQQLRDTDVAVGLLAAGAWMKAAEFDGSIVHELYMRVAAHAI